MAWKKESGTIYAQAAIRAIREAGALRELYVSMHGVDPDRMEMQRFANRLNPARSNPGADFLGLCVANLPQLGDMTLREFFGIDPGKSDHS